MHRIAPAGDEMVDAGVIFVCAAGNDNQRLGIGTDDPHLNDVLTTLNSADTRTGVPSSSISGTAPSGHRNFVHPQRNGYNESKVKQIIKKDKHHIQIMDLA